MSEFCNSVFSILPAAPTNGRQTVTSFSPGASPTIMIDECFGPVPCTGVHPFNRLNISHRPHVSNDGIKFISIFPLAREVKTYQRQYLIHLPCIGKNTYSSKLDIFFLLLVLD
jgi:hypothetical protein